MQQLDKQTAIANSALWAAYADALGFISELTNESGLQRRLGGTPFDTTRPWKRKIGGPYGTIVDLPAGCYSDDTQLRLATTRSIRGTGDFDVELFAKIELPVWLCYDLGAGPTTKAAATALGNRTSNWFSNFFFKGGFKGTLKYVDGGGNGAAMRIQPHVWAARSWSKPEIYLGDVVRNSICTHGHPRAIFGSVFHAMCLAHALEHQQIPHPDSWFKLVDDLRAVENIIVSDRDLSTFWLPAWEKESKKSFHTSCEETLQEVRHDIDLILESAASKRGGEGYEAAVKVVDALSDKWRGTGTKTAVLALTLCWCFRDERIDSAILHGAKLLGSDTDTIGTLAGALFGAFQSEEPSGEVLDRNYIKQQAFRLARIGEGQRANSFRYPDLMTWKAPKSSLDCVGLVEGRPALAGLGYAKFNGNIFKASAKGTTVWEWATLDFGQTVLCARRARLDSLPAASAPILQYGDPTLQHDVVEPASARPGYAQSRQSLNSPQSPPQSDAEPEQDLFANRPELSLVAISDKREKLLVDQLTDEAIKSDFNPQIMGNHLLMIFKDEFAIELSIGYASIVAKAWRARQRRRNSQT